VQAAAAKPWVVTDDGWYLALVMTYDLPLAFGLISPLFLWAGAGLVSVPILIHILNRRRFKVVSWAAMEFLLRAMKKNRRRLRFEQLLLLATRCAVLLLLGLALSRPLGCQNSSLAELAGRRTGLHVLVIGNGYSMAYEADRAGARTHLDQAKIIAKALIHRLSSGGESVAIVTASSPPREIVGSPIYDLKAAEDAVDRIEQSWGATDEAGALGLARDIAQREPGNSNKCLYLIDDSTRVAWESRGDVMRQLGPELAALYKSGMTHFDLGKPGQSNQAIVGLTPTDSLISSRFAANFVADVRGFGPAVTEPKLVVKVDGVAIAPAVDVNATAAASPQTITANHLAGGIHVVTASLASDNRLPVDDVRYRVIDVVSQLKVLIVEGERGVGGQGSSGAFLDAALNPKGTGGYVATERISDLELGNKVLGDYRCICLCGVGGIQETVAAQLEQYVRQGGTVMVFMGDPVTAENYNATLYKHHLLPGPLTKRISVSGDEAPRRFDFNPHRPLNRLLADFQNQEDTGMESAEIYSYWQMDLAADSGAERVLNFLPPDNSANQPEDPAITVHTLGAGQVIFYATSADPNAEWTTFMPHPAYPALMHMLLLGTTSSGDAWMNIGVGSSVMIPPSVQLTGNPVLRDAAQVEYPMEMQTVSDTKSAFYGQAAYVSNPLEKPGVYSLSTGAEDYKIAVNVPAAEEADVRTVDDAAVKKALGDIDMQMLGDSVPAEAALAEQGKDLGWGVMFFVFVLLAVECVMAMRFGHHNRTRSFSGRTSAGSVQAAKR
jgi:Aerotolerance regulator N-terminal/von Willebrand factor type A domain